MLTAMPVYSQGAQSGDWLLGADLIRVNLPVSEPSVIRSKSVAGTLLGGRFLSSQLAVGVQLPFDWQSIPLVTYPQRATSRAYGLLPFGRFYLTNKSLRPYVEAGVGYLFTQYRGERSVDHNGLSYQGSLGLAYFIGRRVSIDAVATLSSRPYQAANTFSLRNDNQFNAYLRFQLFFGKSE